MGCWKLQPTIFILRIVAIILLLLMFAGTFRDTCLYVSFKIKQKYIAENLCINRNEPITRCYGKCFLKEQLNNRQESEPGSPFSIPQTWQPTVLNYILPNHAIVLNHPKADGALLAGNALLLTSEFLSGVFHPPRG